MNPPERDTRELAQIIAHDVQEALSDPDNVTYSAIYPVLDAYKVTKDELAKMGLDRIFDTTKQGVRDRVRAIEQRAELQAKRLKNSPGPMPTDKSKLFRGRYQHGSIDPKKGAVHKGCECNECNTARAEEMMLMKSLWRMVEDIIFVCKYKTRILLTEEFLDAKFRRGDGTAVLWRKGDTYDHEVRVEFMLKPVVGTLRTIIRHVLCSTALDETGVNNLDEMVGMGIRIVELSPPTPNTVT